jgi:hypothetical protein
MERDDYFHVTEVLGPYAYAGMIDPSVLRSAGIRGTRVHEMVNNYLTCIPEDVWDAELEPYLDSFKKWYKKVQCKAVLHRELTLFDDEFCLQGTLDGIYEMQDGELILVDYKTSAAPSKTWGLQLSAYKYMYELAHPDKKISRLQVIHLQKTGEEATVIEYEESLGIFKTCLLLYKYFNPRTTRKRKEPRKAPIGDL